METDPVPRGRRPAGGIPFVAGGLVMLWLGAAVAAQDVMTPRLVLALPLRPPAGGDPAPAFPGELRKGSQEFTFLVGYGDQSEIPETSREDREFLFFTPRWGIVLTDPVGKWFWRGGLEFVTEPSAIITADTPRILSGGIAALLKYNFYTGTRLMPFLEAGAGLMVSTDRLEGQGSSFNFTPQGGAGFHYFLTREWAFTGAYRYWHASNGGYARPNRGVNVNTFFIGLAYFFP
ncbi:MAG: acyloxyacyl hydrolase [candidate division NC10 bacterium]|nr:acyloxyacyl hydrolase [candidate division NC10 bacterium]